MIFGWMKSSEAPDMRCEKGSIVEEMKRKERREEMETNKVNVTHLH